MVVDDIDDEPGQPELRVGDCIRSINGVPLVEIDDCELDFIDNLSDGVEVEVEPYCVVSGSVPQGVTVDWVAIDADLNAFATDYQVELKIPSDKREVRLSGPQSAVALARDEVLKILAVYFPG